MNGNRYFLLGEIPVRKYAHHGTLTTDNGEILVVTPHTDSAFIVQTVLGYQEFVEISHEEYVSLHEH
jgi:hypothetical protein